MYQYRLYLTMYQYRLYLTMYWYRLYLTMYRYRLYLTMYRYRLYLTMYRVLTAGHVFYWSEYVTMFSVSSLKPRATSRKPQGLGTSTENGPTRGAEPSMHLKISLHAIG